MTHSSHYDATGAYRFLPGRRVVGMHTAAIAGALLTAVGLGGYAVGVLVPYPGRAFTLTALMLGLTLLTVGRAQGGTEP
jgi:hypothetical protein